MKIVVELELENLDQIEKVVGMVKNFNSLNDNKIKVKDAYYLNYGGSKKEGC